MASSTHKLSLLVAIAVSALLCIQSTHALRILGLFPLNSKSHFVMCEQLMRGLAARGHRVDVYSHFPLKKPVPNYTDYSLDGSLPAFQNNMSYEFFQEFAEVVSVPHMLSIVGEPICDLLHLPIFQNLLNKPPSDPPYDLVVVEFFLANCYLAWGRYLNAPLVTVVTSNLFDWLHGPLGNPVNRATDPSVFSGFMAPMTFAERVKNVALSNFVTWSFNRHIHQQDEIVRKMFGPNFPDVAELQRDISLTLVNSHHTLNGVRAYTPAVVPVGGLHIVDTDDNELPQKVQTFLDESKDGFIYFSFGSMMRIETFPRSTLDVFYSTFKKIAPIRVLMKIAKPEDLPPGLIPSNVITYHWLPQIKVLKHKNIKAFVTHGGLMGTQESIYHGVPMVGFPLFGDQHFNIESYSKKRLAIKLSWKDVSEPIFTQAVREILQNPVYLNSARKMSKQFRDNPSSPVDTAAFWIEYIARHGKDALQSPLVNMPWWQSTLLDVYGFLIFCVLAVLYVVKFIIKKLISLFRLKQSSRAISKVKKN